jgi:hypothetical protein
MRESLSLPLGADAATVAPRRGRRGWKYGTVVPAMVRDFARQYPDEPPIRIWQRTYQAINRICAQEPATKDARLRALIDELRTVMQDIGYRPAPGSGAMRSIQKWCAQGRRAGPDGQPASPAQEDQVQVWFRFRVVDPETGEVQVVELPGCHPWEPATGQLTPAQERYVWEVIASGGRDIVFVRGPGQEERISGWPDVEEAKWLAYLAEATPDLPVVERARLATWLRLSDVLPNYGRAVVRELIDAICAARAMRPPDFVPPPAPGSLTAGPAAGGCPAEGATDG